VFDAKRLIGREFRDHNVQQDLKHWPFKVVDVGDKPKIQVEFKSEEKTFTPEEISSMVILRTYVLGIGGIMSEDTGRFLLLQKIYSKSLS
jgi:molecular chaperone DnaK (HSP70)